jgi:hypothetical protein
VQVPQQRAVELDAMADESFAVVDEQPQIELGTVQVRGREGLQALLQRGASDVERVDRVRLAALAGTPARSGAEVRRDPQHALTALDEKSLQRPGHVPAVLKRPHTVAVEASRPLQQGAEPAIADRGRSLAEPLAGGGRDRRDRVRTLVSVRAEHDHCRRPPLEAQGRTSGGHGLLEAVPRIDQVTPDIPDRRRATQQKESQALARADSLHESQLAARSGRSPPRRTSPTSRIQTASLDAIARMAWFGASPRCCDRPRRRRLGSSSQP